MCTGAFAFVLLLIWMMMMCKTKSSGPVVVKMDTTNGAKMGSTKPNECRLERGDEMEFYEMRYCYAVRGWVL